MTGGIVSPVFPEMVQEMQFDPRWAGMLLSIHALAIALFTPIMGIVVDRVGKLKVMIPSLVLYSCFGVVGAFISNLPLLLVTRGLLGVSSGAITAACIGYLGTLYEGESRSRVLGYATSAMTTTSILVPLLGGWVGRNHWQHAFYLYAAGIVVAGVSVLVLQDQRHRGGSGVDSGSLKPLRKLVQQPSILKQYILLAIAAQIVYAVVIYTPLYLKDAIGATPELNGMVLAVRGIGAAVVAAVLATRMAKRIGPRQTVALGFGLITPNAYNTLANQAPAEFRASVLAIGTGFNSLGQFVSPLLLGPVWKYAGLPVVFYTTAAIALATGILSLVHRDAAPAPSVL
jgi:MFS transporter, ACDE family, multidrug resistance protein